MNTRKKMTIAQRYNVYKFVLSGLVDTEAEKQAGERAIAKSIARHRAKIRKIEEKAARKMKIATEKKILVNMRKGTAFKDSVKTLFISSARRLLKGGIAAEIAKKDLEAFKKKYIENPNKEISRLAIKIVAEIKQEAKEGKK
ncbi:MAG: hypothetical protein WC462_01915 [archaeon]